MTDQTIDDLLASSDLLNIGADMEVEFPPVFDNAADERRHRKQRLTGALRIFGKLGFAEGAAGHITARDPELPGHFWVNPFGRSMRHLKTSDLLLVNEDGEVVAGNKPVNGAAFAIHSQLHEARPDVVAACHSHAIYSKSYSALGKLLDPISQDACMFYGDHAVHADDGGAVVTEAEAGGRLAKTLGDHKAVIHQNHGIITVGDSVDAAAWWFIAMERACQSQLLAEAAGDVHIIGHEAAQYSFDQTGYDLAGWFQFQSLWEELIAEDGDAFLDE